jgi:hypothetical protein
MFVAILRVLYYYIGEIWTFKDLKFYHNLEVIFPMPTVFLWIKKHLNNLKKKSLQKKGCQIGL